jgi:hypothetical protein
MYTEAHKNNIDLCEVPLRSAEERRGASPRNFHGGGPVRYVLLVLGNPT